ncbi:endonuclease/exonuclease/phosphatase family protein [Mucilaginibacter sp. JRF]|uniref:endonuclease/exonuclease/phosphatase family protein n=1 Tax=Mucilaginibacter sp. JRF TaxID=2780088 RepID=UPI001882608E|nr:endonuclease/exonuclease/phosphatase family protein [Mucilaginibacter sp. JRF]MBE9585787.1 endonuclease/exonuclease/phosphatase family protein [Mucilaginibacter sp. JRF]
MYLALTITSFLLVFIVFLPLVKHSYWVFRALEYPRFQKFAVCVAVFVGWGIFYSYTRQINLYAFIALCIAIIYLIVKIYNYTVFAVKEVRTIKSRDQKNEIKVLSANVYQDNTEFQKLLDQIKSVDPDVIFLLETDPKWETAVKELETAYPHMLKAPLPNTYGLLFYSRFPLSDARVNYLIKEDIPSIEAIVELPSGVKVQLWGLHPEPPVPGESLYSTAKDKELMKIALKARDSDMPIIVFGDLNDVAWSYTTTLFGKVSDLLDVRKGRGFYSTFSAKHWFLRFPLDYIFCSAEFGLVQMRRLPYNGSDHYPIFTHLIFNKRLEQVQDGPEADQEDIEEAKEILEKEVEKE